MSHLKTTFIETCKSLTYQKCVDYVNHSFYELDAWKTKYNKNEHAEIDETIMFAKNLLWYLSYETKPASASIADLSQFAAIYDAIAQNNKNYRSNLK